MVRFIIANIGRRQYYGWHIYIPIWLDLLFVIGKLDKDIIRDLHSNMVRFIIWFKEFMDSDVDKIYIPIWLDLL